MTLVPHVICPMLVPVVCHSPLHSVNNYFLTSPHLHGILRVLCQRMVEVTPWVTPCLPPTPVVMTKTPCAPRVPESEMSCCIPASEDSMEILLFQVGLAKVPPPAHTACWLSRTLSTHAALCREPFEGMGAVIQCFPVTGGTSAFFMSD